MQRLMSVLLVGVAAAACGGSADGGSPNLPDAFAASDGGFPAGDAGPPPQGLELQWVDMPVLPGVVSSTVTVTSVKFNVKKLEVLGDAGALPETTREDFEIAWSPMSPNGPFSIYFESAPPAIYNKVRINIDKGSSNTPSVEILGTTTASGSAEMFRITSEKKLDLEVTGYDITLGIADSEQVRVLVGLDDGLADVNWSMLRIENGARTLEDEDTSPMDELFDDLDSVFTAP